MTITALFEHAARIVADTLANEYVEILEYRPDRDVLVVRESVGLNPGRRREAIIQSIDNTQAGFALQSNEPILTNDLSEKTRFHSSEVLPDDTLSGISVIIGSPRDPWGILGLTHRREKYSHQMMRTLCKISRTYSRLLSTVADPEQELRETHDRYQRILKHLPDYVLSSTDRPELRTLHQRLNEQWGIRRMLLSDRTPSNTFIPTTMKSR